MTNPSIPSVIADTATHPATGGEPRPTRLDPDWDEFAARYLREHPEISAAVPNWADEVDFSEIDDEVDGTVFSFSTAIGDVELYGVGKLLRGGAVQLEDDGTPNVYLPAEVGRQNVGDIGQRMLDIAQDLISAAALLRAEPKVLRRPTEVADELQRLDI